MTTDSQNKKRLIVGMGLTGLSCARFLAAKKLSFDLCDSRDSIASEKMCHELYPQAEIFTGKLKGEVLAEYDEIILSPGIAIAESAIQYAIEQGCKVRGDIDLFSEFNTKPLIAITGSNGKSTVTSLVGDILQVAGKQPGVGGNIGVPALDLLLEDEKYQCYVLELSSFQLETTDQLNAAVACILNLSEDHMDRYSGMLDYHKAKQRVFSGCRAFVINQDDKYSQPFVKNETDRVLTFTAQQPEDGQLGLLLDGEVYLAFGEEKLLSSNNLHIKGKHNLANALAAMALCHYLDVDWAQMMPALTSYRGLPHRCAWVGNIAEVDYFNDSKGTNVGSTIAAIEGLALDEHSNIILIAGGVGKDQNFSPLAEACIDSVKAVYLYGQDREIIRSSFVNESQFDIKTVGLVSDLPQALSLAFDSATAGDIVLFSPACASFDQFKNFEQRGEFFQQLVERIEKKSKNSTKQQQGGGQ